MKKLGISFLFQLLAMTCISLSTLGYYPFWSNRYTWLGYLLLYIPCAVFLGLAFFFENRWKSERGGFYPRFYYIPRFAFSLLPCILYYFWYCISFDFFYGALPLLVFILAEVFFSSVTFAYSKKAKPIEG